MAHEAVIEIDVVSDKYPVAHEPHEAFRNLGKNRRTANHIVRDARDLRYLCRDGSLRIHQRMPLVDDLVVADLDRSYFGYPIARSPTACGLDIDYDIVLLGIEAIVDPTGGSVDVKTAGQAQETLSDDLLEGAHAIAEFLFGAGDTMRNRRRIYHLVETSRLPVFRLG